MIDQNYTDKTAKSAGKVQSTRTLVFGANGIIHNIAKVSTLAVVRQENVALPYGATVATVQKLVNDVPAAHAENEYKISIINVLVLSNYFFKEKAIIKHMHVN